MRLLILSAALALTAAPADAGPIRDRLRARFAPSPCAAGQCSPQVAFKSVPTASAPAPLVGGCYGGKCVIR